MGHPLTHNEWYARVKFMTLEERLSILRAVSYSIMEQLPGCGNIVVEARKIFVAADEIGKAKQGY